MLGLCLELKKSYKKRFGFPETNLSDDQTLCEKVDQNLNEHWFNSETKHNIHVNIFNWKISDDWWRMLI